MVQASEAFFPLGRLTRLAIALRAFRGAWGFGGVFSIRNRTSSRFCEADFDRDRDFGMEALFGDSNPLLPPPRHLSAIGKIAAVWSQIESSMEVLIAGHYELDLGRALVFTTNLSFQTRLSMIQVLAAEEDGAIDDKALAKEVRDILPAIEKGSGDRNELVHAIWTKSDKPGCVTRLRVRLKGRKLKATAVDYSAEDLIAVADRLHDLAIELSDLVRRTGALEKLQEAEKHSSARK